MDETIKVDSANCEEVAQRLVALLKDKTFSITSLYSNIPPRREIPKVITGLSLYKGPFPGIDLSGNGYRYKDGRLTILLSPRRTIFWDVEVEIVTVIFLENESVILERSLPPSQNYDPPGVRIITRVIVTCS